MFVLTRFHHTLKELSHGLCILIHMCSVYCNYQLVSLFIASVVHEGVSSGPQVSYIWWFLQQWLSLNLINVATLRWLGVSSTHPPTCVTDIYKSHQANTGKTALIHTLLLLFPHHRSLRYDTNPGANLSQEST